MSDPDDKRPGDGDGREAAGGPSAMPPSLGRGALLRQRLLRKQQAQVAAEEVKASEAASSGAPGLESAASASRQALILAMRAKKEAIAGPTEQVRSALSKVAIGGQGQTFSGGDISPPDPPVYFRGKSGAEIDLTANYFRLKVEGNWVFEHEVTFEPRIDNVVEKRRRIKSLTGIFGEVFSFDGVRLYLPVKCSVSGEKIPGGSPDGSNVVVTIALKRELRPGHPELSQHYNILFNRINRSLKLAEHNRKFFDSTLAHKIPNHKMEVWPGMITVVHMYEGGLMLQLDLAYRVVRTETVYDIMRDLQRKGGNFKDAAIRALVGESIVTRYNNKSYKIDGIDFQASPESTFEDSRGNVMTYLEYYKRQYNLDIKDPKQFMLQSQIKPERKSDKAVSRMVYLVPELSILCGLTERMRSDFKVMQDLAKVTRVVPQQRQEELLKIIHRIKSTPEANKHLTDWGLIISPQTIDLKGRVLPPAKLLFGKNYTETVGPKADWTKAATSKPVLTAVNVERWVIAYVAKDEKIVRAFCDEMMKQGPRMNIHVAIPKTLALPNDRTETYLRAVRDILKAKPQLVLTVFPGANSQRYSAVKKLCYIECPVASQVINMRTIEQERKRSAVAQKVILQINAKLGGELWACQTPFQDLMVVGIDVYHDKSRVGSSVAGIVSSLNTSFSRFYSVPVFQRANQELVDGLRIGFLEALMRWFEVNNRWPKQIVVFRDGVGDGQIEMTEQTEAAQFLRSFAHLKKSKAPENFNEEQRTLLQRFCQALPPVYKPEFAFIIVQKRINTRILGIKGRSASGPQKPAYANPPPGSVVDHTITRYMYKDFYLVPQNVNLGTVCPTHFIVLEPNVDDSSEGEDIQSVSENLPPQPVLTPSNIQRISYLLTHMYYNWPGTVRVPAPCQYAHKLCDMVGENLKKEPSQALFDKLFYL